MATEIIYSGGTFDLYEDDGIALTFSIADFRDLNSRYSTFSKTIKLPGTKNNNDNFQSIYDFPVDLNENVYFNTNVKINCQIISDYITQAEGYIQLNRIFKDDDTNEINYEIQFYGLNATLMNDIKNKYLTDLDFSDYDHCFKKSNIEHSWTAGTENGYVYPMIDYGVLSPEADPINDIYGVVWSWYLGDYRPALYVKTLLDKIFATAGYTYTSNFLNSDLFKKLIIPFGNERFLHNQAWCDTQHFKAYQLQDETLVLSGQSTAVGKQLFFPDTYISGFTSYSDCDGFYKTYYGGTQFSPGFGLYFVRQKGKYQFSCGARVAGFGISTVFAKLTIEVKNINNATDYKILAEDTYASTVYVVNLSAQTEMIELGYGDQVTAWLSLYSTNPNNVSTATIIKGDNTFFKTDRIQDCDVAYRQSYSLNDNLPINIKQEDFLRSIITMFNLYIEPDTTYSGNYIIEPYDNFYSGVTQDWTHKLDISQTQNVSILSNIQPKEIYLKYKDDSSDRFLKKYKETYNEEYGQKLIVNNNYFSDETKKYELIFSPTVIHQASRLTNNWALPVIYPENYSNDNDYYNSAVISKSNIRILMYNGLVTLSGQSYGYYLTSGYLPDVDLVDEGLYYNYPMASHFDDPYNSTVDINFDLCRRYYFDEISSGITQNNLFTNYYEKYFLETLSPNSKLLTAYFNLKESDIQNLSFRNPIFINGIYYKLNKIIDFKPGKNLLTKVELVQTDYAHLIDKPKKIVNGIQISNKQNNQAGRANNFFGELASFNQVAGNTNAIGSFSNSNSVSGNKNIIAGTGNIIGGIQNSGYSHYSSIVATSGSTTGLAPLTLNTGETRSTEIVRSVFSHIAGGTNHQLYSDRSSIIGGNNNYISGSTDSAIVAGTGNTILNSSTAITRNNTIIGGNNNFIGTGVTGTAIIGSNITATTSDRVYVSGLVINGTDITNDVQYFPNLQLWTGDTTNYNLSSFVNLSDSSSSFNTILSPGLNSVINTSKWNTNLGGYNNMISGSALSLIFGYSNTIKNVNPGALPNQQGSLILGGVNNTLSNSENSGIFCGFGNSITNLNRVFIFGRTFFTATNSFTSYFEHINGYYLTGSTTQMVVADANGTLGVQAIPSGSSSGATGITGATNAGAGTSMVSGNTSTDIILKSLSGGTNISIDTISSTSNLTINSTFDISKYKRGGGYWYSSSIFCPALLTSSSLTANRMNATPLIVSNITGMTISGLAFNVATSGNTAFGVGIYDSNPLNQYPRNLVYGGTTGYTGDCSTTSVKIFTGITSDVVLQPGLYYLVGWSSASSGAITSLTTLHGVPNVIGSVTPNYSQAMLSIIHTQTWNGGTMPSAYPSTSPSTAANGFNIQFRVG